MFVCTLLSQGSWVLINYLFRWTFISKTTNKEERKKKEKQIKKIKTKAKEKLRKYIVYMKKKKNDEQS